MNAKVFFFQWANTQVLPSPYFWVLFRANWIKLTKYTYSLSQIPVMIRRNIEWSTNFALTWSKIFWKVFDSLVQKIYTTSRLYPVHFCKNLPNIYLIMKNVEDFDSLNFLWKSGFLSLGAFWGLALLILYIMFWCVLESSGLGRFKWLKCYHITLKKCLQSPEVSKLVKNWWKHSFFRNIPCFIVQKVWDSQLNFFHHFSFQVSLKIFLSVTDGKHPSPSVIFRQK